VGVVNVAVCCSVLQCDLPKTMVDLTHRTSSRFVITSREFVGGVSVAGCCSVLQCVAGCCSVLPCELPKTMVDLTAQDE